MLEDFSYADTQVTEGSLLSHLWEICEASRSTVKLVLPDTLDRPFYLPKLTGRKALTPAQVDRENKRNEFLSQRDVASFISPKGKRNEIVLFKFHKRRDIEIEARLLDEFRYDKEKLASLMAKVSLKKKLRFKDKSKKKVVLKDKLSSIHEHRFDEIDRHHRVTMRKSVMLMAEEESRDAVTQSWRNRVSQMMAGTSQAIMQTKNSGRAKSWIAIVSVLNKLAVLTSIVVKARKVKAKNKNKWRACIVIQKAFRHHLYRRIKPPGCKLVRAYSSGSPKILGAMRKSFAGNSLMQQKYIARRDACNVIIQVLRDSQRGFKASVLGFIRKVKIVQRMVRAHMVANSGRVQLVQNYMDELYPVLATHTSIVLADRGLDLRNMSSMDGSKVKVQLGHKQWMHIVPELNTFSFHQYLRNYQEHLSDVNTVFGASGKMLYASSECSVIRRTCILDMVFKKRRQYVARLFAQRKLVLNIPQVTLSDVRSFIGGGVDPVQTYLVAAYRKYDASVGQQLEYQAGMKIHDIDANGNKVVMMRSSCMSLLKAVTPEDMGLLYVTLAEKLIEQRTLQLAQKANSRRHTAYGKLLSMQKMTQGGTSLHPMLEARLTAPVEDEEEDSTEMSGGATLRPASPPGRKGTTSLLESSRRLMAKKM